MKTTNKILIITLSLLLGLSIFFAVFLRINATIEPPVEGSGNIVSIEQPIGDFVQLRAGGNFKLILDQGDSVKLTIKGDDNLVELVNLDQKNGNLEISLQRRISRSSTLELHLTVSDLKILNVYGSTRINSAGALKMDSISINVSSGSNTSLNIESLSTKINASSGSHVELSGTTGSLDIISSSGASIKCLQFLTEDASVSTSSGASNEVNVSRHLLVVASSGSTVLYTGNPTNKTERISSGASVKSKN